MPSGSRKQLEVLHDTGVARAVVSLTSLFLHEDHKLRPTISDNPQDDQSVDTPQELASSLNLSLESQAVSSPDTPRRSRAPYTNVPLPLNDKKMIRLLKLENKKEEAGSEMISCSLHVVELHGGTPFVALSYMWGDETVDRDILINGELTEIRENLWNFLDEMRSSEPQLLKETTYLWIDALCIDQTSVSERNHQVAIMGDIYSKADTVVVWLGKLTGSMEMTMSLLRKLQEARHHCERCYPNHWRPDEYPELHEHYDDLISSYQWGLQANPYWNRAWIVQEIILGAEVYVCCGSYVVPLHTVAQLHSILNYEFGDPLMGMILDMRRQWHEKDRRTFISPWAWHKRNVMQQCSDKRDRIYSMVGLMDPKKHLVPDYSLSPTELFHDLVYNWIPRDSTFLGVIQYLSIALSITSGDPTIWAFEHGRIPYSWDLPPREDTLEWTRARDVANDQTGSFFPDGLSSMSATETTDDKTDQKT